MNTTSFDITTPAAIGPGVARASVQVAFGFPDLAGQAVSFNLTNTESPCYVQELTLANGDNNIAKPASAGALVIVPPVDNKVTILLKGINADTGVPLHVTAPTLLTLSPIISSFVITTSGSISGMKLVWF